MGKVVKTCKYCGVDLVWDNGISTSESSDNIAELDICKFCLIEHCCTTNCLGCEIRKYPNCKFLDMKKHYLKND